MPEENDGLTVEQVNYADAKRAHAAKMKRAKREAAVILADTGLRPSEVAAVVSADTVTVKQWLTQYDRDPESFSEKTRKMKMAMMDGAAQAMYDLKTRIENGKMRDLAVIAAINTLTSKAKELNDVQEEETKPDWSKITV